ncbi:DegT/DnrJ/EryC1/StrS aminotransferase [Magnetococcus marinus MC-1]|uniref:DegT/DnrJ/EryC1/StrS aminotransferase n=1 Tax=Magnetococcus marinus (strain ATCC BAA-1437 / JCM 17883 / MC-1) TaxID=156889 RepID=A0L594_MAGMM|nr:DegT/DnrJ/EryC1/StrS family aminotransferase [Magnetococcus marinus]ABK43137.1 DegT/DnrJ/EryC1/StrS aminotransferase [Magnetococcus marinus MC-1]
MSFYPLAFDTFGPEEKQILHEVIDSGYFTMGARVKQFEAAFADYFGVKHAIMLNSGSSANLAAVAALFYKQDNPLKAGDEAIVPAISWSTTYHPLQQYGMRLRVVDVEPESLNMDVRQLEAALTPKTRLLVGVSILGNPAALDVMRQFADQHGLYFLEDNCESCDASLNGQKTGTFGDLGTFSFFFSHHISTMEGGMVLTNHTELDHRMRAIRAHGWSRDIPAETDIFQRGESDHFEAYRFLMPGYNLRPGELHAAVGVQQLAKMPEMTARRRQNLALFQSLFQDDPRFIIQRENGVNSSFCFPIVLNPAMQPDRNRVFAALKAADIDFRIITGGCFTKHDMVKYYDYDVVNTLTHAETAHDLGFFVGNAPVDLTAQIHRAHGVLDKACS